MTKKNKEPIKGIGRDPENKLIVQKARPLFALANSDLTLAEFKIMDAYLARIDTRKPEHRTVKLTKGQLEEALGVTRINKPDLEQRLKNLCQPINLAKSEKKHILLVGLFEEAQAEQDENGVWQVTLTCTTSAMKYFFTDLEKMGYLRYAFRFITNMSSRYTYLLFLYLESNRLRKTWEVSLVELKRALNCENEELYNEFKMFNQRILKRCQKELHEKTECRFAYSPVRKGRNVVAIHFELETLSSETLDEISDPNQLSLFDASSNDDEQLALYMEAVDNTFDTAEMEELLAVLRTISLEKLPLPEESTAIRRYHYLEQKYKSMNRYNVKNKYSYLLKILQCDAEGDH